MARENKKMKLTLEDIVKLAQDTATDVWGPRDPKKLIEKLREETDELEEALLDIDLDQYNSSTKLNVLKEFGDVLFCLMRFADQLSISPGDALAMTIVKIQERDKFDVANRK